MTANTPESGLRARLPRLARTTGALAIAVGLCALGAPAAAGAAVTAAEEGDGEPTVELHLSAGLRGTMTPGSSTSATISVENDGDTALTTGRVSLEISRTPLGDDAAISAWLDDDIAVGEFTTLGTEPTEVVAPGEAASATVFVPADALDDLTPGVYPLRAALTGAAPQDSPSTEVADVAATSVLIVSPSRTTQVGVLVPVTATPADGALLTAEELTALTAPEGALTAQLDGVAGTSAVLAIDPAIVAAIRVLGSAAPESATQWLTRLEELPNERFALQFGDADAAVQAQADLAALLQPTTLAPFLDPADFPRAPVTASPTESPQTTPAPTPVATEAPVLPDDQELTAIDGALPGIVWPGAGVTADDLLDFAGYLGDDVTTIVSSTAVGGRLAAHADADDSDLLVTADALSDAVSAAAGEPDSMTRQRHLAEAAAHLFVAATAAPDAPLLVGLSRDETRTADALRDAISAADSLEFDFAVLRGTAPAAATIETAPAPERSAALGGLLADEQRLVAFSSILQDPQVLLSPERIRILRTISVGSSGAAFAEKVATHRARTTETLGAVRIPPSSTIQLLTANADLPFAVRNDLPWPVTVQLNVAPTDPRLEVQAVTEAQVQPNTTQRVRVPVSARVGSGELDLRLNLYSPTGVPIQGDHTVRVAVRAEWETIGLAVLGTLVVLLIGLGVVRTVRRKRQEASGVEAPITDAADLFPESKDGRE